MESVVIVELSRDKQRFVESDEHALAMGGPGCGKTFVALCKAQHEIELRHLKQAQRILFLSFARATVARVAEQARTLVSTPLRSCIEINTYHGFAWALIRSHGYLLTQRKLTLLPPPAAASHLADVTADSRTGEMLRLRDQEGLLHFDLFATTAAELLSRSRALTQIVCGAYPIIILDEFQDTNADEWRLIQSLGQHSRLIALADPEQRIYEFRGADPARIGEFINSYAPAQFDFSGENHRSNGTDIVTFGNDLLTGANKSKRYADVAVLSYRFYRDRSQHFAVKAALLQAMSRCIDTNAGNWSIAVLVPSKRFMLTVSDYLSAQADGFPALSHDVALDTEGPAIAAVLIAGLLDPDVDVARTAATLIRELCAHVRGRRGTTPPTKNDLKLTDALSSYLATGTVRGSTRLALIADCRRIADARLRMTLTGDPEADWLAVRELLADSGVDQIQQVAEDAKYLRLLHKGALLRSRLGELWRGNRGYPGAAEAVHDALLQEHFSASTRAWKGVNLMTIHKSKGKEFDEVLIYEGAYQGRIVRANASAREVAQARLSLRVAVTRAMKRTTLLTPQSDPCTFL